MESDKYSLGNKNNSDDPESLDKIGEFVILSSLRSSLKARYRNMSILCWLHSIVIFMIIYVFTAQYNANHKFKDLIIVVSLFVIGLSMIILGLALRFQKMNALWGFIVLFGIFAAATAIYTMIILIYSIIVWVRSNQDYGLILFIPAIFTFFYAILFFKGIGMVRDHRKILGMTANTNDFRFEEDGWREGK
jgi:hypothetical protein